MNIIEFQRRGSKKAKSRVRYCAMVGTVCSIIVVLNLSNEPVVNYTFLVTILATICSVVIISLDKGEPS